MPRLGCRLPRRRIQEPPPPWPEALVAWPGRSGPYSGYDRALYSYTPTHGPRATLSALHPQTGGISSVCGGAFIKGLYCYFTGTSQRLTPVRGLGFCNWLHGLTNEQAYESLPAHLARSEFALWLKLSSFQDLPNMGGVPTWPGSPVFRRDVIGLFSIDAHDYKHEPVAGGANLLPPLPRSAAPDGPSVQRVAKFHPQRSRFLPEKIGLPVYVLFPIATTLSAAASVQYLAQASISSRRFSNRSPRR